jgi:hypothetical protein
MVCVSEEVKHTDVEVVGVTDVHASDTDATKVLDGLDALVQDLAGVGLEAYRQLDGVEPALGVLAVVSISGHSVFQHHCFDITHPATHSSATSGPRPSQISFRCCTRALLPLNCEKSTVSM